VILLPTTTTRTTRETKGREVVEAAAAVPSRTARRPTRLSCCWESSSRPCACASASWPEWRYSQRNTNPFSAPPLKRQTWIHSEKPIDLGGLSVFPHTQIFRKTLGKVASLRKFFAKFYLVYLLFKRNYI